MGEAKGAAILRLHVGRQVADFGVWSIIQPLNIGTGAGLLHPDMQPEVIDLPLPHNKSIIESCGRFHKTAS